MISRFKVFLILVISLLISCKKENPTILKEDLLTEHISTAHFDYYYSKPDEEKLDTTWQENYYTWLIDTLNLTLDTKLKYYKYRDINHIKRVTGNRTNGFAEIGTYKFHSIWNVDNHECVHTIVTQKIGHPPALFNEGIAVAYQADYFKFPDFIPGWNGQDFNQLSKGFNQNGKIPPLSKLIGAHSFWDYDQNMTYPISGSFVRYLIDNYGLVKMKALIQCSKFEDSSTKIRNDFYTIYSITIDSAWNAWISFITTY